MTNNLSSISMTRNLNDAIDECARIVIESELHDLPLGARQWIWFCLGEKSQGEAISSGHRKRYSLAKKSVQKIIPFWLKFYRTADKINEILDVADDAIDGRLSRIRASELYDKFLLFALNLKSDGDRTRIISNGVCSTAIESLCTAIYDERFDPSDIDLSLSNDSIDGFDYDASFSASLVYAGGGVGDKNGNPVKRREFWLWWLRDAVRAASELDTPTRGSSKLT